MAEKQKKPAHEIYEIKLKGHLDTKWTEWFYDMTITHESDGTTTLRGPLPDQAVLHSVLNRIRDMNLTLINVRKVNAANQEEPEPKDETMSDPEEGVDAF
jgi:hypothetical protein